MGESQIDIRINSNECGAAQLTAAAVVDHIRQNVDLTYDRLVAISSVVSEAVKNCVTYAYPNGEGDIFTRCQINAHKITITILDRGVGIPSIKKAQKTFFTTGSSRHLGIGFALMKYFSDSLKVRSAPNQGTTISLCFDL